MKPIKKRESLFRESLFLLQPSRRKLLVPGRYNGKSAAKGSMPRFFVIGSFLPIQKATQSSSKLQKTGTQCPKTLKYMNYKPRCAQSGRLSGIRRENRPHSGKQENQKLTGSRSMPLLNPRCSTKYARKCKCRQWQKSKNGGSLSFRLKKDGWRV